MGSFDLEFSGGYVRNLGRLSLYGVGVHSTDYQLNVRRYGRCGGLDDLCFDLIDRERGCSIAPGHVC